MIRAGGTWQDIDSCGVRVGGTWQTVDSIHIRVGGTWRQVWSGVAASLTTRTVQNLALFPTDSTCYYRISSDGSAYGGLSVGTFLETWRDGGSNSDFEVRATLFSGTTPSGTLGSWLDPATSPTWSVTETDVGTTESVIDVEIRNASTLAVLTTARITMQAIVEAF